MDERFNIFQNGNMKYVRSKLYNCDFNTETGHFIRWGTSYSDDPEISPIGPEIADIEISEICNQYCAFCYKDNKMRGRIMLKEKYLEILQKFGPSLQQVALGIGNIDGCPELEDIFKCTRDLGIVPNITINGNITDIQADMLVKYCGAVAVSYYEKDTCFDTIKLLTDKGLKQCNIHCIVSNETYDDIFNVLNSVKFDKRLTDLNAIVFLSIKNKGRAKQGYTNLDNIKFKNIVDYCLDNKINFGFDSCSACKFDESVIDRENSEMLMEMSERCESTRFSIYINVEGKVFPCSFCEGEDEWKDGIDINNFNSIYDIWIDPKIDKWRKKLISNDNSCIMFKI